jgi:hypothetical protein
MKIPITIITVRSVHHGSHAKSQHILLGHMTTPEARLRLARRQATSGDQTDLGLANVIHERLMSEQCDHAQLYLDLPGELATVLGQLVEIDGAASPGNIQLSIDECWECGWAR